MSRVKDVFASASSICSEPGPGDMALSKRGLVGLGGGETDAAGLRRHARGCDRHSSICAKKAHEWEMMRRGILDKAVRDGFPKEVTAEQRPGKH